MASILILSEFGDGLSLVDVLKREGHLVKVYAKNVSEGLPYAFVNAPKMLDQYDLILRMDGLYRTAQGIEDEKKFILGGGLFARQLNRDAIYQKDVLTSLTKIKVSEGPPSESETLFIEGWFNGEDFTFAIAGKMYDRLMDGERGPYAYMGNAFCTISLESKLMQKTLIPLKKLLKLSKYRGALMLHLHITEEDLIFGDILAGAGSCTLPGLIEILGGGVFNFLWGLNQSVPHAKAGKIARGDYALCVRASIPPYPYISEEMASVPQYDIPEPARKHIHEGHGVNYVVMDVTARGGTIQEARRRAYRTVRNVTSTKDVQYRSDIGSGMDRLLERLKVWGWIDA